MAAAARAITKFAGIFGVGAGSGYMYALFDAEELMIKPPTFANLEFKPAPLKNSHNSIDWGPVVQWDYNWDKRDFMTEEDSEKPKATRHLILIRHGQYNLKGKTDPERYLSDLGREQAVLTGHRLAELNLPLTYLVSSTMTRAQQTAGLIRQSLPEDLVIRTDDGLLCEGAPYPPEPPNRSWNPEDKFYGDGMRIEAAFRKYFHRAEPEQDKDSYEIIVCHSNVIRYFVCRALQLPPEAWLRISLKHASVTAISIRPNGKVSVRGMGEAGHLPVDKLTTT